MLKNALGLKRMPTPEELEELDQRRREVNTEFWERFNYLHRHEYEQFFRYAPRDKK